MIEHRLAPPIDAYQAPSAITEAEVVSAYRRSEEARPCACGLVVVADPVDPTAGVAEHQAEPKHRAWREWMEL